MSLARALISSMLLATAVVATSAGAVPSNQQLTIATTQEFETLNPMLSTMSASTYLTLMVNRPLVIIDANWNFVCGLCDHMPSFDNGMTKVIDDKGKKKLVAEWHVRKGVKWSDGKAVTATDFRLAWEIGRSPNVATGGLLGKDTYERIETFALDPADPLKFTITYNEPRFDFYQLVLFPLPAHLEGPVWEKAKNTPGAYEKQTTYATDPTHAGLYNGPYAVGEIKLGSHVVMRRNPNFGGSPAHIEKIVVKLIPNTQTLEAAVIAGDVDMVSELGMSFDQAVEFDKRLSHDPSLRDRFKVVFRDGLIYEHVDLNLHNPILAEKNVRKALLYALDRKKLSQALFAGKQAPANEFFHPIDPYYSDDVTKYDYDPKKSAELLDASGWKLNEDGIRYKDGKKLELNIMTTSGNKVRELVEQFMQAEFKKVGVATTLKNEMGRVFFAETVRKGQYPAMAMFAWTASPDSPPRTTLHSQEIPTRENGWNGQNSGGFSNKRADQLLDEVYTEFNLGKRKTLMAELMKIYTEELPVLPLYLRSEIVVEPAKMTGLQVSGHQFYSTVAIEHWEIGAAAH